MRPNGVQHLMGPDEPRGVNVLYGDGHANWRRYEEMEAMPQGSYTHYW